MQASGNTHRQAETDFKGLLYTIKIIIDREAGEIMRLVASVCLSVYIYVCVCVFPSSPV